MPIWRSRTISLPKKDLKEYSTNKYYNFRDVKEQTPLAFVGCLVKEFSDNILSTLNEICYTTYQEFYTVADGSKYKIYEKILEDLRKTRGTDELLLDPIYVIVYQDGDDTEYEKLTKLLIIYPKYPKDCSNQERALQKFFNQYLHLSKHPKCTATAYKLNKNHKMFYDIIQKKVYATL